MSKVIKFSYNSASKKRKGTSRKGDGILKTIEWS